MSVRLSAMEVEQTTRLRALPTVYGRPMDDFTSRIGHAGLIFIAASILSGCGVYDGLFNEPVDQRADAGENQEFNAPRDTGPSDSSSQDISEDPDGDAETTDDCRDCTEFCVDGECVGVRQLSSGARHTCALVDDDRVVCWGDNGVGQLARPPSQAPGLPRFVDDLAPAESIRAGWEHTCAILKTGAAVCWGDNSSDQLGADDGVEHRHDAKAVNRISDIEKLASGYDHSCAIYHDTLACWGGNLLGQIGIGESGDPEPTPVDLADFEGTGISDISAGWYVSAAVDESGGVWVWGDNEYGELGDTADELPNSSSPTEVSIAIDAIDVSTGWRHLCALGDGGQVQCWGSNETGQLGRTTSSQTTSSPDQVQELPTATAVDTGWGGHSCAIAGDALYCWGDGEDGQLGNATSGAGARAMSAVEVLDELVDDVAVGLSHTCATASGRVYCWGDNDSGQLGVSTPMPFSDEPVQLGPDR